MRISKNWLSDFVDLSDVSITELEDLLTTRVAEVDNVERVGKPLNKARWALIKEVKNHPSSDKLRVIELSLGNEQLIVVSAAPNVVKGGIAAYLPPGASFLSPETGQEIIIESRELLGVQSSGVLVSEAELGLGSSHEGIFYYEDTDACRSGTVPTQVVGGLLSQLVGDADDVLVIDNKSVTHRADLWSHHGFAREIAAILKRPLKLDIDSWADDSEQGKELLRRLGNDSSKGVFAVKVDPRSRCRRFMGIAIENVSVEASPLWMRRRLFAVGAGVRNFLVDLSNYVMHDVGQPNHAYDASCIKGDIIYTRLAVEGEKFLGLDAVERTLTAEDVVIADGEGPVALGGVIGGATSSIQPDTNSLFLESANFDPVLIRKVCKRHQIRTDASNRFEKDRSPYAAAVGLQRFLQLLTQAQVKAQVCGRLADDFHPRPSRTTVSLSHEYLQTRLSPDVGIDTAQGILTALGFGVKTDPEKRAFIVDVPYYRSGRDITIQDDLVEEVGRIFAYDNIPEVAPLIASTAPRRSRASEIETLAADCLVGAGFSECYCYSFMSSDDANVFGFDTSSAVRMLNPIDATQDLMRTSLVPNLLRAAERNRRYGQSFGLFEIGRVYQRVQGPDIKGGAGEPTYKGTNHRESRLLCLVSALSDIEEATLGNAAVPPVEKGAGYYALSAVVKRVLRLLGVQDLTFRPLEVVKDNAQKQNGSLLFSLKNWMHPYVAASVETQGKIIGVMARVNPAVIDKEKGNLYVCELDLDEILILGKRTDSFCPISRFPDSYFEVSVVASEDTEFASLVSRVKDIEGRELIRRVEPLYVYRGEPLASGQKSVSLRLTFGSDTRTLSSDELKSLQEGVVHSLSSAGFNLRT